MLCFLELHGIGLDFTESTAWRHCVIALKISNASTACMVHVHPTQYQTQAWPSLSFGLIRFSNFLSIDDDPSFGKRVSDFIIVCFIFFLDVVKVQGQ